MKKSIPFIIILIITFLLYSEHRMNRNVKRQYNKHYHKKIKTEKKDTLIINKDTIK